MKHETVLLKYQLGQIMGNITSMKESAPCALFPGRIYFLLGTMPTILFLLKLLHADHVLNGRIGIYLIS